jgi:uncharacterized membrane protein
VWPLGPGARQIAILPRDLFPLKYVHILGAIVLLGTGGGIAFFMLMAHRSRNAALRTDDADRVSVDDVSSSR